MADETSPTSSGTAALGTASTAGSNNNNKNMTVVTSQSFWDAAKSIIDVTERHPFLVNMVDGTLEEGELPSTTTNLVKELA